MFSHPNFDLYNFEGIPLDVDLILVDQIYMQEIEDDFLSTFIGNPMTYPGYYTHISARSINKESIDLVWYVNTHTRWHAINFTLPKDQFICCVGCWKFDADPIVFVKSAWLNYLFVRSYSQYCMIDAVDFKKQYESGKISHDLLHELRNEVDCLASKHLDISFISFADSLILKSNWTIGAFNNNVNYTYNPELLVDLAIEVNKIFENTIGTSTYAIFTQGNNEYYDDSVLHISKSKNHVSFNSLGQPFAQLLEIDNAVRHAIKHGMHEKFTAYLDEQFFNSLDFSIAFDKAVVPSASYFSKYLASERKYFGISISELESHLSKM